MNKKGFKRLANDLPASCLWEEQGCSPLLFEGDIASVLMIRYAKMAVRLRMYIDTGAKVFCRSLLLVQVGKLGNRRKQCVIVLEVVSFGYLSEREKNIAQCDLNHTELLEMSIKQTYSRGKCSSQIYTTIIIIIQWLEWLAIWGLQVEKFGN